MQFLGSLSFSHAGAPAFLDSVCSISQLCGTRKSSSTQDVTQSAPASSKMLSKQCLLTLLHGRGT